MLSLIVSEAAMGWSDVVQRVVVPLVMTVISFVVGRWWGRYRAQQQWRKKEFLGRIIISLNTFADDKLKIRTIFERSLEDVFLNAIAIEKVHEASRRCAPDQPLLPIAKEDCWYLLNFVLNAVAEQFSEGFVRADAGEPVKTVLYSLFLTCEVVGEERIRKVRAMVIRKDHLIDFPYKDRMPLLENPWHDVRVHTLRKASETFRTRPEYFIDLELNV
jgi:hypothetical protein